MRDACFPTQPGRLSSPVDTAHAVKWPRHSLHAMRPLSLASYDVLLRTGNPLVKGEMPMGRSWIADCRSWMKSIGAVLFLPSTIHNPRSAIFSPHLLRQPHTRRLPDRVQTVRKTKLRTGSGPGTKHGGHWRKKASPCDEPGFLAAQVFALAAATGWPEKRILFMPLARLAQYQHCLLRRNGVRTHWSSTGTAQTTLREQLAALRVRWVEDDAEIHRRNLP